MKIFFNAYGYRETKRWDCSNCGSYSTSGADIYVDENIRRHQQTCHPPVHPFQVWWNKNGSALLCEDNDYTVIAKAAWDAALRTRGM